MGVSWQFIIAQILHHRRLNFFGKLAHELDCKPMFINFAGTSGKIVMSKRDNVLFFVHDEMCYMSNFSTEQTTKVTQLSDGLEERVESLFEELAKLKLKGAIGSAFVDGGFKYYGSDATIKERVSVLEEKREAELAIKEETCLKRKRVLEEKRKAEHAKRLKRKHALEEEKRKAEHAKRLKKKHALEEEKCKAEEEKLPKWERAMEVRSV